MLTCKYGTIDEIYNVGGHNDKSNIFMINYETKESQKILLNM